MSTYADVILLWELRAFEELGFSVDDGDRVRSLLCVLTNEMTVQHIDYEARIRLYFYLGLHGHEMQRWVGLLSVGHDHSRELGRRLADAFRFVTSDSILKNGDQNDEEYCDKVATLSRSLHSLYLLIRPC